MNAAIQVAKHLKVNHWQIVKVEEWAKVLFAVVKGLGARFVSKKVVKMKKAPSVEGVITALSSSQFVGKKDTQFHTDKPNSVVSVYKGSTHLGYIRIDGDTVNLQGVRPYRRNDIESVLEGFECIVKPIPFPAVDYNGLEKVHGRYEVEDAISDIAREDWDI